MNTVALHRTVRMTARASALLFAASQAATRLGSGGASRPLYLAFMVAHAAHFAAVSGYAVVTGGQDLFPGGRSMQAVGGWPTVLGIYTSFAGLACVGLAATATPSAAERRRAAGLVANGVIGAMFVGTYLGELGHRVGQAVGR